MNLLVTTSGYIVRLKELIGNKISLFLSPNALQRPHVKLAYANPMGFTREKALHMLLDQGKTYREAELVISTLQAWGMDLEQVAFVEFEVHGTSVWIKAD